MMDKKALRTLTCGLYIVTARDGAGCNVGCVINTLTQVASEPPTVSIALSKGNATTKAVQESGAFAVTVLGQTATMELIGLFGFRSSLEVDKFADVDFRTCGNGSPFVADHGVAWLSARVEHVVDVGSHLLFVGPVEEAEVLGSGEPMSYAYYHGTLRGKTPPKAVSYQGDAPNLATTAQPASADTPVEVAPAERPAAWVAEGAGRNGWQCTSGGEKEEGYPDGLPADYRCPLCGVGPEFFERVEL